jgi:hypothetical protein
VYQLNIDFYVSDAGPANRKYFEDNSHLLHHFCYGHEAKFFRNALKKEKLYPVTHKIEMIQKDLCRGNQYRYEYPKEKGINYLRMHFKKKRKFQSFRITLNNDEFCEIEWGKKQRLHNLCTQQLFSTRRILQRKNVV